MKIGTYFNEKLSDEQLKKMYPERYKITKQNQGNVCDVCHNDIKPYWLVVDLWNKEEEKVLCDKHKKEFMNKNKGNIA